MGWENLVNGKVITERAAGLIMVIESHYERSRESWGWRRPGHASSRLYTACWLIANGHSVPRAVLSYLQQSYPPPNRQGLDYGKTYWSRNHFVIDSANGTKAQAVTDPEKSADIKSE